MDLFENNFPGSFADENVTFKTEVVKTTQLGDQYWKPMIFVDTKQFVEATTVIPGEEGAEDTTKVNLPWREVPGTPGVYAVSVNAEDAMTLTKGLLQSWLTDLFLTGFAGDCILVAFDSATAGALKTAYESMKMYGYFKSICVVKAPEDATEETPLTDEHLDADLVKELCALCALDNEFISSVPFLPFYAEDIEGTESSSLFTELSTAKADAFMSAYSDATRNAALYALGLALSQTNGSGTCIGNGFDMWQTKSIGSSGTGGLTLERGIRKTLNAANVQTWKPVGDNSALVAAEGAESLQGTVLSAAWVVAYITYMSKVGIARLMTQPNYFRTEAHYREIVGVLAQYIAQVGQSGRLSATLTVPAFKDLPSSPDQITIKDAWEGQYKDVVRTVNISGKLYIGTGE